jgi:hypothetical protein
MQLECSTQIFKNNTQKSKFMKIRPVAAELFHADRQTDTPSPKKRVFDKTIQLQTKDRSRKTLTEHVTDKQKHATS